jgi:ribosomal protein L14
VRRALVIRVLGGTPRYAGLGDTVIVAVDAAERTVKKSEVARAVSCGQ